jgi:hypothetical protein
MNNTRSKAIIYVALLVALVVIIPHNDTTAQSRLEIGFTAGPSNFLGDLGGGKGKGKAFLKDNMIPLTRLMAGFHVGYFVLPFLNFELQFSTGRLEGADSLIKDKGGFELSRKQRDQHFRSPLKEVYLAAKFYPTTLLFEYDPESLTSRLRPYLIAGIGMFNFNPQGQYIANDGTTTWVDLKPLRTEGQGMPSHPNKKEYNLTQINIPYGFGIKYFLSQHTSLSFELVNRKTFTDYIDDVSTSYINNNDFNTYFGPGTTQAAIAAQMANKNAYNNGGVYRISYGPGSKRGTSSNLDSYYSSMLKLNIRLRAKDEPRLLRGSQFSCPRF